ncbi:hypothetical protein [Streptomyces sp. NPDC017991]|uniref:hypothetical protein n=1 Tax=Streptomyces sp. NPDC017991 TaxID=3365026 RepID=UPI0037ABC9B6
MTEEERQVARMQRINELVRNHTKAELLRMAYAGGLIPYNNPEKWSKDEIASTIVDTEFRTADQPAPAPPDAVTPRPVPAKPLPQASAQVKGATCSLFHCPCCCRTLPRRSGRPRRVPPG